MTRQWKLLCSRGGINLVDECLCFEAFRGGVYVVMNLWFISLSDYGNWHVTVFTSSMCLNSFALIQLMFQERSGEHSEYLFLQN